jgi:mannose-6-phosphate isomerase
MHPGRHFFKLDNQIQHYPWGSPRFIPELIGKDNPSHEPWAEMWMGVHPGGLSFVECEGKRLSLKELIEKNPTQYLGPGQAALPFLFKLLAAAKPLSIQAHPNMVQAAEGFARENAAGIPLDAPERNYKDPNHKPEIIVALTPFTALAGYRPAGQAPEAAAIQLAARLQKDFPGDPGNEAPLRLNLLKLQPGEALFIPAGILHAYIEGFGVELMANSDNVLRGGLTQKHIDREELQRVLRKEAFCPKIIRCQHNSGHCPRPGVYRYPTDVTEFSLFQAWGDTSAQDIPGTGPFIAVVTDGALRMEYKPRPGRGAEAIELNRGESVFIPWGEETVSISGINGDYTVFIAGQGCALANSR